MNTKSYSVLVAGLSCVLFWSGLAFGAEEILVADKATGCRVFKPNAKSTDTVTWRGKCASGFADGPGTAQWFSNGQPDVRFDGTFKAGRLQGKGVMVASGGDRYEGEYKDGLRDGRGVYVFANGGRYEGEYKANLRDGKGLLTDAQGNRIALEFKSGQKTAEAPVSALNKGPVDVPVASLPVGSNATTRLSAADSATWQLKLADCNERISEVWGVIPQTLDLKTGPSDGKYVLDRLPNPALRTVIEQAHRFAQDNCKQKAVSAGHRIVVRLFYENLPAIDSDRARNGYALGANLDGTNAAWDVYNITAYWETPQGKADMQRIQRIKQEQQADKNTEIAMKAKKDEFLKRYRATELERIGPLFTNPFAFEGKTVLLYVQFGQMTSATTGSFEILAALQDRGGRAIVSDIPRGALMEPTRLVMAAQVLGKIKVQGPYPEELLHLKLIGFEICVQSRCPF